MDIVEINKIDDNKCEIVYSDGHKMISNYAEPKKVSVSEVSLTNEEGQPFELVVLLALADIYEKIGE